MRGGNEEGVIAHVMDDVEATERVRDAAGASGISNELTELRTALRGAKNGEEEGNVS